MKYKIQISLLVMMMTLSNLAAAQNLKSLEPVSPKKAEDDVSFLEEYKHYCQVFALLLGTSVYIYGRPILMKFLGVSKEHADMPKDCCASHRHGHGHSDSHSHSHGHSHSQTSK